MTVVQTIPPHEVVVRHDVRESFGELLRAALTGVPIVAALGPIYEKDPAGHLLLPFRRSAVESDWEVSERDLAPEHVLEQAQKLREAALGEPQTSIQDLNHWTRAGLVLEIAHRRGIKVKGRGVIHVPWRLKGTVTGRFGTEPVRGIGWTFNPLSLSPDDRWRIVSQQDCGEIAVIDYRAMDLCSMAAIVPGLAERFGGDVSHERTAEITGLNRDVVKLEIFVHAYGGRSVLAPMFERHFPEISILRKLEHGEAARAVQATSAQAFRAGLSAVLPRLTGEDIRPLFTVHDELALDISTLPGSTERVEQIASEMAEASSAAIGVPYRTALCWGATYAEAKG